MDTGNVGGILSEQGGDYQVVVCSHYSSQARDINLKFLVYFREVLSTLQSPLQHCINKQLSKMMKTFKSESGSSCVNIENIFAIIDFTCNVKPVAIKQDMVSRRCNEAVQDKYECNEAIQDSYECNEAIQDNYECNEADVASACFKGWVE